MAGPEFTSRKFQGKALYIIYTHQVNEGAKGCMGLEDEHGQEGLQGQHL